MKPRFKPVMQAAQRIKKAATERQRRNAVLRWCRVAKEALS